MDTIEKEQLLAKYKAVLMKIRPYFSKTTEIFSSTGNILDKHKRMARVFAPLTEFQTRLDSCMNNAIFYISALQVRRNCDEQFFAELETSLNQSESVIEEGQMRVPRFERYATILTNPNINLQVDALQLSEFADKVNEDYQDTAVSINNFVLTYDDTPYEGLLNGYDENMQKAEENAQECKNLAENPISNRLEYAMQIVEHDDQTRKLRDSMEYYKYTLETPYYDEDVTY